MWFPDFIPQSGLPGAHRRPVLSDNAVYGAQHNHLASSVTSGFHALLGTSRNPDKAVKLGAVSGRFTAGIPIIGWKGCSRQLSTASIEWFVSQLLTPPKSPRTTSGWVLSGTSVQSKACPTMKTTA